MSEQEQFIDADAIYTEQGFTFKNIVMEHIRKLSGLLSQELRGGYMEQTLTINNGITTTTEKYIPDTRMQVINAIIYLDILLLPHFDIEMQEKEAKIENQIIGLTSKGEEYKEKLLSIRLGQFRELSKFLHRKNYFDTLRGEE